MNKDRFKRVYVEITNKCNLNCEFCKNTSREKQEMSIEKFEHILKELDDKTKYIYLHVKGEPLMYSKLKEILDKINEYNKYAVITTNGTLLKKQASVLAAAKCIRQINISLHSMTENNVSIEDTEKYLKEVIRAVDEIKEKNDIYISYRIWNINDENKKEKSKYILNYLETKYSRKDLEKELLINSKVEIGDKVYINIDDVFIWPQKEIAGIETEGTCYGLIMQLAILVDGSVVPCCLDSEASICLGNIFNTSLDEILASKRAKNVIQGFKNKKCVEEFCKTCSFKILKRK